MERVKEEGFAGIPRTDVSFWFHLALVLTFFTLYYIAANAPSAVPVVFGRYSYPWFAVQVWNIAAFSCLVGPRSWRTHGFGYLFMLVSTFLVTSNESLRQHPMFMQAFLSLIRLLAAFAIITAEFDRFRRSRRVCKVAMASGFALAALSLLDLSLWAFIATTKGFDEDHEGYRDRYALSRVTSDDIVIVGDSFVWGHGVRKSERFGNVLEQLYAKAGHPRTVYSLGVRGAGLDRYYESLGRLFSNHKAGAVVVSFYPNDMPTRPKPRSFLLQRLETATWRSVIRASRFARCMMPWAGLNRRRSIVTTPRSSPISTLAIRRSPRWEQLTRELSLIYQRAQEHSESKPILMIIPLMVDFAAYPLTDGHDRLRKTGETLGFEVLDLLPEFRAALGDGSKYRVHPGDNHFDARVHARVAAILKQRLDARAN